MTAPAVTVYSQPGCMACVQTKRHLDRRGVAYAEVELSFAPQAKAALAFMGVSSLPGVCVSTPNGDQVWGGYRPDRLDALAVSA